jgi:hypothetical protein
MIMGGVFERFPGLKYILTEQCAAWIPERLLQLDQIWDRPSAAVLGQIEQAAQSNDALIRQAATEALGRLALPSSMPQLVALLSDPSKLVQRTAAWSLRQVYGNHTETGDGPLLDALLRAHGPLGRHPGLRRLRRWWPRELTGAGAGRRSGDCRPHTDIRGLWQGAGSGAPMLKSAAASGPRWRPTHGTASLDRLTCGGHFNLVNENIRYPSITTVTLLGRPDDRDRAIADGWPWNPTIGSSRHY